MVLKETFQRDAYCLLASASKLRVDGLVLAELRTSNFPVHSAENALNRYFYAQSDRR